MESYRQKQAHEAKVATVVGITVAVLAHLCLAVFGMFSGLKYIYPPPQENSFVVDFVEEEETAKPKPVAGRRPQAEEMSPDKKIELVQSSEAQHIGTKQNEAEAATIDDHGDVETPVPEQKIDKRALFSSADNNAKKDTLAAQTARKASNSLKAGNSKGNTAVGKADGTPKANLQGRHTVGVIAKPAYPVQDEGIVVVDIWVDRQGKVQKAVPGAEGTTVINNALWQAARKAAMETKFNNITDATAPERQQGTITYIFKLTQ